MLHRAFKPRLPVPNNTAVRSSAPMHESRVRIFTLLIVVLLVAVFGSVAQTTGPSNVLRYLHPSLPVSECIIDLVGGMTLEEKASQVVNTTGAIRSLQFPAHDRW